METFKIFCLGGMIVAGDKIASNGVVHLIDRVLVPRRAMLVLDLLRDLGLTTFANLVERGSLLSTFTSHDTFTVFAPINLALEGQCQILNSLEFRQTTLETMRFYSVFQWKQCHVPTVRRSR